MPKHDEQINHNWVVEICPKLLVKEFVMEKLQSTENGSYEWPQQFSLNDREKPRKRRSKNNNRSEKETPEMVIRSLQGIFCKGRYRSWMSYRGETP